MRTPEQPSGERILAGWLAALDPGRGRSTLSTGPADSPTSAVAAAARQLDLRLSLVTVAEPAARTLVPGGRLCRAHGPDTDPLGYLHQLAAHPGLDGLDVGCDVIWDPIGPHAGLARHLHQQPAALVAITTHARTGPAREPLGSEAASIVHEVPYRCSFSPPASAPNWPFPLGPDRSPGDRRRSVQPRGRVLSALLVAGQPATLIP